MQLKSVKAVFVMEMFVRIHSLQRLQYKNYGHPVKLKGRRLRRNKKCFFIILHVVNLWTSFCRIQQVTRFPKMRGNTRQVNEGQSYRPFINCQKLCGKIKGKRKIEEKKRKEKQQEMFNKPLEISILKIQNIFFNISLLTAVIITP